MPRYLLRFGEREIILNPGAWSLGRAKDCDIHVDDPQASRYHATIEVARRAVWLHDRGSRNGIYVNGKRIDVERELTRGDVIRIGKAEMHIVGMDTVHDKEATTAPVSKIPEGEEDKNPLAVLSPREREVLALLAQGYSQPEIAPRLRISVKTVETYRARISEKLDLKTRAELVQFAMKTGLVPLP